MRATAMSRSRVGVRVVLGWSLWFLYVWVLLFALAQGGCGESPTRPTPTKEAEPPRIRVIWIQPSNPPCRPPFGKQCCTFIRDGEEVKYCYRTLAE
jgi:hypothetical protein